MKRIIKRYSNRKLYDTVTRRFTTLDDIARLLESGQRIVVRDHDTGEDRTDEVLAPVLARLVARQPGGADLIAGLLRAPVQIADGLTGGITGTRRHDEPGIEITLDLDDEVDDEDEVDEPAGESDPADRHEAEIRELRAQVSQLTDAVLLLVEERNAAAG